MFRDSPFFQSISEFFVLAPLATGRDREEMTTAVTSLLFLLDIYIVQLPTDSKGPVKLIILTIENVIIPALTNQRDLEGIKASIALIKEKCEREVEKTVEKKQKKGQDEDPPEDYRTLSIFPTKDDFEKKPFLR